MMNYSGAPGFDWAGFAAGGYVDGYSEGGAVDPRVGSALGYLDQMIAATDPADTERLRYLNAFRQDLQSQDPAAQQRMLSGRAGHSLYLQQAGLTGEGGDWAGVPVEQLLRAYTTEDPTAALQYYQRQQAQQRPEQMRTAANPAAREEYEQQLSRNPVLGYVSGLPLTKNAKDGTVRLGGINLSHPDSTTGNIYDAIQRYGLTADELRQVQDLVASSPEGWRVYAGENSGVADPRINDILSGNMALRQSEPYAALQDTEYEKFFGNAPTADSSAVTRARNWNAALESIGAAGGTPYAGGLSAERLEQVGAGLQQPAGSAAAPAGGAAPAGSAVERARAAGTQGAAALQYAEGAAPATPYEINWIYNEVLGRDVDLEGLNFYASSGWTADQIRAQIARSPEAAQYAATNPTRATVERPQDFAQYGENIYTPNLRSREAQLGAEARPYAQGRPASAQDIYQIYTDVLGRAPDQGGLDFYSASGWSPEQIRAEIARSEEARSRAATSPTTTPPAETTKPAAPELYVPKPGGDKTAPVYGPNTDFGPAPTPPGSGTTQPVEGVVTPPPTTTPPTTTPPTTTPPTTTPPTTPPQGGVGTVPPSAMNPGGVGGVGTIQPGQTNPGGVGGVGTVPVSAMNPGGVGGVGTIQPGQTSPGGVGGVGTVAPVNLGYVPTAGTVAAPQPYAAFTPTAPRALSSAWTAAPGPAPAVQPLFAPSAYTPLASNVAAPSAGGAQSFYDLLALYGLKPPGG